ncbi:hypothetical protein L915_22002 [Phytophthora nicotianae]|uniref:Uncharacterized protein n=2 Tax=Phytophthora nicotianae TaxID=4792 RepID=W2FL63_PHYNI|nr:hypothetical protein L915_22002 [Phytophthora nicotianae]
MSSPPQPSVRRFACTSGTAEEVEVWLALLDGLDDRELGYEVAGHILPAPKALIWPCEGDWMLDVHNPFLYEQPTTLEQVLLPQALYATDPVADEASLSSAAATYAVDVDIPVPATCTALLEPEDLTEPTNEYENQPIESTTVPFVIEIDSSSLWNDYDDAVPRPPPSTVVPHL